MVEMHFKEYVMKILKDRKILDEALRQGLRTAAELAAYIRSLETRPLGC